MRKQKIVNTANFHSFGTEDQCFGYVVKAGKKYELHFVAKFPVRVFETLLEAQQFIHRVHPMAYVGYVGQV